MNWKYIAPTESGGAEILDTSVSLLQLTCWTIAVLFAFIGVDEYGAIGMAGILVGLPFDFWACWVMLKEQQTELLSFYAKVYEPIFEWQQTPDDGEVFNRANAHRNYLALSGNSLFARGKIDVVEMYWRDPAFDYCETFEEFEARRSDMKKDYLRDWARRVTKADDAWRKQFMHHQQGVKLNGSEVLVK